MNNDLILRAAFESSMLLPSKLGKRILKGAANKRGPAAFRPAAGPVITIQPAIPTAGGTDPARTKTMTPHAGATAKARKPRPKR